MEQNFLEKDQSTLYFGKYLNNLRKSAGISTADIGRGICSESEICLIEKGKRNSSKIMRDFLLERAGATVEEHVTMLNAQEYASWADRQQIIRLIITGDVEKAKKAISNYERTHFEREPIEEQFVLTMKAMIMMITGVSATEILGKALALTYFDYETCTFDGWTLSSKELSLLMEWIIHKPTSEVLILLEKIWQYISAMNYTVDRAKTLLIASLAYKYVSIVLFEEVLDITHIYRAYNIVKESLSILRKNDRLYYIRELNDSIVKLCMKIKDSPIQDRIQSDTDDVEKSLHDAMELNEILNGIEREAGVKISSFVWPFLYLEEGCSCVSDTISKRRKMLGMTRKELSKNICTEKTLMRTEKKQTEIHFTIMRELLVKLGLSGEYERGFLILGDEKTKRLEEKISRLASELRFEEALAVNNELKQVIIKTPENLQFIGQNEAILLYRLKRISLNEMINRQLTALNMTIDITNIKNNDLYFTRNEIRCLYLMILHDTLTKSKANSTLEFLYMEEQEKQDAFKVEADIRSYELLAAFKIKKERNKGNYYKCNLLCKNLIMNELKYLRLRGVWTSITNMIRLLELERNDDEPSLYESRLVDLYRRLKTYIQV